jgi:hypothetical protein
MTQEEAMDIEMIIREAHTEIVSAIMRESLEAIKADDSHMFFALVDSRKKWKLDSVDKLVANILGKIEQA